MSMKKIKSKSILIVALLSVLTISGCQNVPNSDSQNSNSSLTSGEDSNSSFGFPYTSYPEAYPRDPVNGVTVIKQPNEAFPKGEMTFRVDSLDTEFYVKLGDLFEKGTDKRLINSVYSLYLADVNKDGYLDFIFSTGSGRPMKAAGVWIGIYDYHNQELIYSLDDPGQYDYRLSFEEGKLCVTQYITDYYDSNNVFEKDRMVGKGILNYSGNEITTKWQNYLNIDSYDFNVTLADKTRTPVTMKPSSEANTYVIENASVDDAYCITTNIKRNSGNYDDLTTDLCVGYRLNGYYRLIQATANNRQDNVIVSLKASYLKYNESKTAVVEVCVSSFIYKIVFQIDTYDYASDHKTLIEYFGWNFTKSDIVEFYSEFIPGVDDNRYGEESYPFVYVSVASNQEATETSYDILEAKVVEIDPALVKKLESPSRYYFKTNDNSYSCCVHNAMLEYNDVFYLIVYSRNYSYAFSASNGYVRFRDAHKDLLVSPFAPGTMAQLVHNATDIRFKQRSLNTEAQKGNPPAGAQYTFNIAGNQFYIIDAKTMVMGTSKYEVVSDADFSSLFPVA